MKLELGSRCALLHCKDGKVLTFTPSSSGIYWSKIKKQKWEDYELSKDEVEKLLAGNKVLSTTHQMITPVSVIEVTQDKQQINMGFWKVEYTPKRWKKLTSIIYTTSIPDFNWIEARVPSYVDHYGTKRNQEFDKNHQAFMKWIDE